MLRSLYRTDPTSWIYSCPESLACANAKAIANDGERSAVRKYARIAKVSNRNLQRIARTFSENRLRGLAINDALLPQKWRSLATDVLSVTDRCDVLVFPS